MLILLFLNDCYIRRKMESCLLQPLASKDFQKCPKPSSLLYFVINGLTVSISFLLLYMLISGMYPLLLSYLLEATWVPITASLRCITSALAQNLPERFLLPRTVTALKDSTSRSNSNLLAGTNKRHTFGKAETFSFHH